MRVEEERPTRADPTPPDPFVGQVLGGCRIDEVIGRGGMGVVYKATQLSLNRPVAIKVLPEEVCGQPQFVERFKREVDILSRLSHPNIVTVFERGEIDGRLYVIMEYVQGASLREVMRKGPLPATEALSIVRGVLAALEHAHAKGIIHRDIKPENVLVAPGGIVKVADFGLSRLLEQDGATRLTHTQLLLGTFEYMAPEQREKAKEADERADIYATGVVLYEMLAGELPIGHFAALSRKRPKECDSRIDEIVERSLAKSPEDRYQHASDMGAAVSRVLSVPLAAAAVPGPAPAPPAAPPVLLPRARPWVRLLVATVLAGLAFVAAVSERSAHDGLATPIAIMVLTFAGAWVVLSLASLARQRVVWARTWQAHARRVEGESAATPPSSGAFPRTEASGPLVHVAARLTVDEEEEIDRRGRRRRRKYEDPASGIGCLVFLILLLAHRGLLVAILGAVLVGAVVRALAGSRNAFRGLAGLLGAALVIGALILFTTAGGAPESRPEPSFRGEPSPRADASITVGSAHGPLPDLDEFLDPERAAWIGRIVRTPFPLDPTTVKLEVVEGKVVATIDVAGPQPALDAAWVSQFGAVLARALEVGYPGAFERLPGLPAVDTTAAGPPPGPSDNR
jgi:predicted Ser/Thr protein kinase